MSAVVFLLDSKRLEASKSGFISRPIHNKMVVKGHPSFSQVGSKCCKARAQFVRRRCWTLVNVQRSAFNSYHKGYLCCSLTIFQSTNHNLIVQVLSDTKLRSRARARHNPGQKSFSRVELLGRVYWDLCDLELVYPPTLITFVNVST